jgi:glycine/D-amino acid oxidase-like deaminating enzyme
VDIAVIGCGIVGCACARPVSPDGRPLPGPLDGIAGFVVASGHGAWGSRSGPR